MSLLDDIRRLSQDSLTVLDETHDYYKHTMGAWLLVQEMARQGRKVQIRNQETNNTVTEKELPNLARRYIIRYLTPATFQNFVSLFENFISDFLRLWLTEFPQSLSNKSLKFQTVLESTDKPHIIRSVVEKELLGLAYDRIENWFKYLDDLVKLNCPDQNQIQKLAEIKASRDVLVHNNGIVNSVYLEKSRDQARFQQGDPLEIPESYHRESWQLIKRIISDMTEAAVRKLDK